MRISATPPRREPVKPTALMRGSATSAWPISRDASNSSENTPAGSPHSRTAAWIVRPTSSDVPGCAPCALTITGHPAASADAVSPPATENASGKLDAPNTATGPIAILRSRRSTRGSGLRCARAGSMRASMKPPSRTTAANSASCPTVRARSPSIRARGSPDSAAQRSISASPSATMCRPIASRNAARASRLVSRYASNASSASAHAASRSCRLAPPNAGSSGAPVAASIARNAPCCPNVADWPIKSSPVSRMVLLAESAGRASPRGR